MASERQAQRAALKKEQIASAARGLFLARSYAGTTMDGVTAAAGVSKQTLYSYFPGKADLLAEILTEEIAALGIRNSLVPRVGSLADFRAALLAVAQRLTKRLMRDEVQQLLRLVIGEATRLPELRDVVRTAFPSQVLKEVEALIGLAMDQGLVTAARPDLSARMFVGPVMSFVILDALFRSDASVPPDDETLAYIVDAFLASFRVDHS